MRAEEIMSSRPACCLPNTSLEQAAQMMCDNDCGELPVIDSEKSRKPIGVITDRDICCRGVAAGKSAAVEVRECMSQPVVTVTPETDLDACCRIMEENMIRRIPVVDRSGACCGMISQADIVRSLPENQVCEVMREVSQPSSHASRVQH